MTLALSITAQWMLQLTAAGLVIFVVVAVLPWALLRGRPHRSWFQRTVLSFNVFLVLAALVAAFGLEYFFQQIAEIPRVELGEDVLAEGAASDEPQNFLLVGIDQSEGLDELDPVTAGRNSQSQLSDTVMILRVTPEEEKAQIISFPRDLWIPIAGTGGRGRINTALSVGGPETLIRTIEENFGIPIHHYVQVNFLGFKQLVGGIGGVPMFFPDPARDPKTGLFVEVAPGGDCVTLDGDQALSFVRSRNYQTLVDGRWETDGTGDLGRISRQQEFIRLALQQAIDQGARNPTRLQQFIDVGQDSVVLDDALTTGDVLDLGAQFGNFDPDTLEMYELPVRGGFVGAASVVFLVEEEAQGALNVFRGVSNLIPTMEGVRVDVRNGSGTSGQATTVSNDLADLGFTIASANDADSFGYEASVIRHGPDDRVTAIFLARFIDGPVVFEEVPLLGTASVELVTGRTYQGILDDPLPLEDFEEFLPPTTATTSTTTSTTIVASDTTTSTVAAGDVPEQERSC